jgi:hypothetical protein
VKAAGGRGENRGAVRRVVALQGLEAAAEVGSGRWADYSARGRLDGRADAVNRRDDVNGDDATLVYGEVGFVGRLSRREAAQLVLRGAQLESCFGLLTARLRKGGQYQQGQ